MKYLAALFALMGTWAIADGVLVDHTQSDAVLLDGQGNPVSGVTGSTNRGEARETPR